MNCPAALSLLARITVRLTAGLAIAAFLVVPAAAASLPPSTVIAASPEPDPTGGTVIAGGLPIPFVAATFSGLLTSTVIENDPSNPFGGLTFTYQISNDAISAGEINRLSLNGFLGALADASFQTPAAGTAPTLIDRDAVGDVVGFNFLGPPVGAGILLPGLTSALLVVQTDANDYIASTAAIIDGSVTTAAILAPLYIIPEPSTFALATFGLAVLAAVARRRAKLRLS